MVRCKACGLGFWQEKQTPLVPTQSVLLISFRNLIRAKLICSPSSVDLVGTLELLYRWCLIKGRKSIQTTGLTLMPSVILIALGLFNYKLTISFCTFHLRKFLKSIITAERYVWKCLKIPKQILILAKFASHELVKNLHQYAEVSL